MATQVFKKLETSNQDWVAKKVNEAVDMLNQNMSKTILENINHEGVQAKINQANAGLAKIANTTYKSSADADAVIDNLYYRILAIFAKIAVYLNAQ